MDRRMTYELHMGFHGMTTRVTDSDDACMRFFHGFHRTVAIRPAHCPPYPLPVTITGRSIDLCDMWTDRQ